MLYSLPTELIRQIIESTVPHTFHSTTYQERQNTLLSLSLVSKLFQSIAQPLLFEIVWIKSPQELIDLPFSSSRGGGGGTKWSLVRWMIVEFNSSHTPFLRANVTRIEHSLSKLSAVVALTLRTNSVETINLSFMTSCESAWTASLLLLVALTFDVDDDRALEPSYHR
jgi:hypothetical protein